jgi:hypothetical protein
MKTKAEVEAIEATVRADAEVAIMEAKPLPPTPHITVVAAWTGHSFLPNMWITHN